MASCTFCYLRDDEEEELGAECPFCPCTPELQHLIVALYVPVDGTEPVQRIPLQKCWGERMESIEQILMCERPRMSVLDEDGEQQLLAYHHGKGRMNMRLINAGALEVVRGDSIVTILSKRSGQELSLPRNISVHDYFAWSFSPSSSLASGHPRCLSPQ